MSKQEAKDVQEAANLASKNSTDNLVEKVADSHRERQNWDLDSLPKSAVGSFLPPLIIGITGLAGSGKDTLAAMLMIELGLEKYGFADPIKSMVADGLGIPKDTNKDQIDPRFGVTYRRILQTLGTDWGRELIHKDIWIILSESKLENRRTVISDVRFNNEAIWIRDRGYMIHLHRPGIEKILESNHSSEQGVIYDSRDIRILNDEGLGELTEEAAKAAITIENYEQEKYAARKKKVLEVPTEPAPQTSTEDRLALLEGKLDGLISRLS